MYADKSRQGSSYKVKQVFTVIAASLFTFLHNLKRCSSRSEKVCCKNREDGRDEENTVLVSCILLRRITFWVNTWHIWVGTCINLIHRYLTKISLVMSNSLLSKAVGSVKHIQVLTKQWVSWKCMAQVCLFEIQSLSVNESSAKSVRHTVKMYLSKPFFFWLTKAGRKYVTVIRLKKTLKGTLKKHGPVANLDQEVTKLLIGIRKKIHSFSWHTSTNSFRE
jgi:hypothetical protein